MKLLERLKNIFKPAPKPKKPKPTWRERREERKKAREAKREARRAKREEKKVKPEEPQMIQEKVKEAYPDQWGPGWTSEHEERLKESDQEWRLSQQEQSYQKFNEHYGMSRYEWEEMFDDIGGAMDDLAMYLEGGSPTVVEMYRYYKQEFKEIEPGEFVELVKNVREENPGINQEQLVDRIYFEIDRRKESEKTYG